MSRKWAKLVFTSQTFFIFSYFLAFKNHSPLAQANTVQFDVKIYIQYCSTFQKEKEEAGYHTVVHYYYQGRPTMAGMLSTAHCEQGYLCKVSVLLIFQ